MVSFRLYKCPVCDCFFATKHDLYSHKKTHWKKTKNGLGEIAPAKLYPELANLLRDHHMITLGEYNYILLSDGETLYRWRR